MKDDPLDSECWAALRGQYLAQLYAIRDEFEVGRPVWGPELHGSGRAGGSTSIRGTRG